MLGHSIVSQHFMEPQGSIPNSQQLSTCSYLEPDQSSPHYPIPPSPISILILYYPPTYVLVFLVVSFRLAFPPIIYTRSSSPHSCYMNRKSHPPRLDYSNYTWRRVQITKPKCIMHNHNFVQCYIYIKKLYQPERQPVVSKVSAIFCG
jgi:hypothetical protein